MELDLNREKGQGLRDKYRNGYPNLRGHLRQENKFNKDRELRLSWSGEFGHLKIEKEDLLDTGWKAEEMGTEHNDP